MTVFDFSRVRVTRHAWDAMKRRDVAPEDLADVLSAPEIREPHKGRTRLVRGPVCPPGGCVRPVPGTGGPDAAAVVRPFS
ncbi:hypothetical protein GCM10010129_42250 [Streptomyces fumigatiscleroticus]|nr:hypothetical protein GCM10010129_42250 [Streptomyces fumigatiscleroticus]